MDDATHLQIPVEGATPVSALLQLPADASALYVFAHGAGAGMAHPFMAALAARLAAQRVGTLRYQFPYMEQGRGRVDSPAVATATVRAAVERATREAAGLPLFAGGKSFGGRMTSTAQSERPLPVAGIAFVGFPLHPAGKPGLTRAAHLSKVAVPMLFLQGTRDELADLDLLRQALAPLGTRATLELIDDADHAFHVRKSSGSSDAQVLDRLAAAMAAWFRTVAAG